jgi:hypothetical protein
MGNTNKDIEVNIFINSLKAQLSVLEAKIKHMQKSLSFKKFADFYGILAEAGESSEDEISAAEFKIKEDLT